LILIGACVSFATVAQPYPNKPVTMVVPQATGGTNDIVARLIAPALGEAIGTSIVVENRPGAGGNIGTQSVARSAKDGYTLLLTINSAQAINPAIYKNPGFDPVNDFVPLFYIGATPYVLVSPPGSPYKTLADVVSAAKKRPGELSYASAGNGTISHLLGAMLNTSAGIDMQHIPYKGVAPAINDVLGGQVPLAFASLPSALNYIKSGKLQAIAISSAKRSSAAPDIPTIAETYPDCVGEVWVAIFAPIGVNADVVKKVQLAMDKMMVRSDVREKLIAQGLDLSPVPPAKLSILLKDELAKWVRIVKASGAQLD
jgi:tripartite-type tricarboxylate transporter receptor subunit TctC